MIEYTGEAVLLIGKIPQNTNPYYIITNIGEKFNMRMRKKRNGEQRITNCSQFLAPESEIVYADPSQPFGRVAPVYLEIGCGKGSFICENAKQNPSINYYAIEKVRDVMVIALERAAAYDADIEANLRFIIGDAETLPEYFPESSVDVIFLNFSDPWPKKGHAKRRLTYRTKLDIYKKILRDGGEIRFKSDNDGLFEFTLEECAEFGLECVWKTTDLHNSEYCEGNIMTEYERNFSEKGKNINSALFVVHK